MTNSNGATGYSDSNSISGMVCDSALITFNLATPDCGGTGIVDTKKGDAYCVCCNGAAKRAEDVINGLPALNTYADVEG